jgi:hypothetical protein
MPTLPPPALNAEPLLQFNRQLLDQALALVAAHEGPAAPALAGLVGSHLRHVIEHLEGLLFERRDEVVDYDSRRRDALLERSPTLARQRLQALQQRLAGFAADTLNQPVRVLGQCGPAGEHRFSVDSTIGRELAFLASHTVHHFALLKAHCQQQGIHVAADFGQAPATVAHARASRPLVLSSPPHKELSCQPSLLSV